MKSDQVYAFLDCDGVVFHRNWAMRPAEARMESGIIQAHVDRAIALVKGQRKKAS